MAIAVRSPSQCDQNASFRLTPPLTGRGPNLLHRKHGPQPIPMPPPRPRCCRFRRKSPSPPFPSPFTHRLSIFKNFPSPNSPPPTAPLKNRPSSSPKLPTTSPPPPPKPSPLPSPQQAVPSSSVCSPLPKNSAYQSTSVSMNPPPQRKDTKRK